MNTPTPLISVCIITYKRNERLLTLLNSLASQTILEQESIEIIVVDNLAAGSAKKVVDDFSGRYPDLALVYAIEPNQGIPLARNHSLLLASGKYVAFIDDDEKADSAWLEALYTCIEAHGADAVFGPVEPLLPSNAPSWIQKGRFYDRPHHKDGASVSTGRTSNALVRKKWLDKYNPPFDTDLRFTGGSDSAVFNRMLRQGAFFCWAENAIVYEFVDCERLNIKWLVMRAFRGGQGHAWRYAKNRSFSGRVVHLSYRSFLCIISIIMIPLVMPFGRHRSVWWLRKLFSNLGQIVAFLPYKYEEYKQSKAGDARNPNPR
jgi:succinoglycan biosynthesis protein ExoM